MSVELREWLQHVDKAQGISGGLQGRGQREGWRCGQETVPGGRDE
jgi:hypothetical protein